MFVGFLRRSTHRAGTHAGGPRPPIRSSNRAAGGRVQWDRPGRRGGFHKENRRVLFDVGNDSKVRRLLRAATPVNPDFHPLKTTGGMP